MFIKFCVWFNTFTKLPHHLYSQREFLMHEEKKVGEKRNCLFPFLQKKTKWGFACQDILYNNINVVHIAAKITKWPQAKISTGYIHDQNLCEIELPISVFLASNLFFAEKLPLHFGIDLEQDRIIWWHSILFRKCYISACYIYQKQSCVFLSRKSDNTSRSNIIRKLHTNKTF